MTSVSPNAGIRDAAKILSRPLGTTHDGEIQEDINGMEEITERIAKFMDMASQLATPGAVIRKIDKLERKRAKLEAQIVEWRRDDEEAAVEAGRCQRL
jgi:hypothetical protein